MLDASSRPRGKKPILPSFSGIALVPGSGVNVRFTCMVTGRLEEEDGSVGLALQCSMEVNARTM